MVDLDELANTNDDPPDEYGRVDNITNWCLARFQQHYNDTNITKDDIWQYIYGVLHASDWREEYANDLRKTLPRIPFAPDFQAFRQAGEQLIELHTGYETCEPWPLTVTEPPPEDDGTFYRIDKKMCWNKTRNSQGKLVTDRSTLYINDRCKIGDIPDEAHMYKVNGRTPLEWAIARLQKTKDKTSGIKNNPNQWHTWKDHPYNLVLHIQRLVRVSVETHRIVTQLPPALVETTVDPVGDIKVDTVGDSSVGDSAGDEPDQTENPDQFKQRHSDMRSFSAKARTIKSRKAKPAASQHL